MSVKSSFTISAIVAISVCIIGAAVPASACLDDQLFKLLPKDGVATDRFGNSVAIYGAIAIVGARANDDNGWNSGSAYLFDISDPVNPVQVAKLLPKDGSATDWFGISVAITGEVAIVGASQDDDNGNNSGSAYLFDISEPENPVQIAKLLPKDGSAEDLFGHSVAISEDIVIIGAPGDDGLNSSSAYLFGISDPSNPTQLAKLIADDTEASDFFGLSLALDGALAIVGAPSDDDNGLNSGSAYLFDISDPEHPLQLVKLLARDGAAGDYFAWAVALSGANAFIGAYHDDDNGNNSGSAYIFDIDTGKQITKFLADDGAAGDDFAWSIAISGTTAIFGAPHDDDHGFNSGSAYIFDISNPENPAQIGKIRPKDGAQSDYFGDSIAISGTTAIIGSPNDDDNGNNSGSAYLFVAPDTPCPWDLDNSGSVGTSDLLELFAQWGTDGPADFDESGSVDTADLLILFANWGTCP